MGYFVTIKFEEMMSTCLRYWGMFIDVRGNLLYAAA
jgi:hypothetical protein